MLAFQISVDGEQPFVAGIDDCSVLSAIVSATFREPDGEIELTAGGLSKSDASGAAYHSRWSPRQLRPGSTVTIELIETDQVDEPLRRYRSDRKVQESPWTDEEIEAFEREEYERLKARFEG